ncbi:hypothetical protein TWF173_008017 [Orbilia oligospora]|nr:hypothetical protein TWF173_008017 [Orbilia oligospora]
MSLTAIRDDISTFLEDEFSKIRKTWRCCPPNWPSVEIVERLAKLATPLFISAVTMSRFVKGGRYSKGTPETRLQAILKSGKAEGFSSELDRTYLTVLEQLEYSPEESASDPQGWMQFCEDFRKVVGTIVTIADPLSTRSLAYLLGITGDEVNSTLRHLYSVLNVPSESNSNQPVRLLHLSFREFLIDPEKGTKAGIEERSKDRKNDIESKFWYYIDERQTHNMIMARCIRLLSDNDKGLKENICLMEYPGMSRRELTKSTIKERIPEGSQYACRYWVHHLEQSGDYKHDEVRNRIYEFLRQYFLEWLETLSLIGQMSECINLINTLRRLFDQNWRRSENPRNRRIQASASRDTIIIWDANSGEELVFFDRYFDEVTDVAFSPDGNWLASASKDWEIRLWDINALIGRQRLAQEHVQTLQGHTGGVLSIAYSPDGKLLASGSEDHTTILWEVKTGKKLGVFDDLCFPNVLFTPDGKKLAIASANGDRFNIYCMANLQESQSFESDRGRDFHAITFSPSGKELAFSMSNGTIELRDAETGKEITIFGTHNNDVVAAAFSPDGKILASASLDGNIGLWDTAIYCGGEKFKSDSYYKADDLTTNTTTIKTTAAEDYDDAGYDVGKTIYKIVFSPDGKHVASRTHDGGIIVWDVRTGRLLNRFKGDAGTIYKFQFRPDNKNSTRLIASTVRENKEVRLWDMTTGQQIHHLKTRSEIYEICFTPNGKRLALLTASGISLWDVAKGKRIKKFRVDHFSARAMTFCPNGKYLVISRKKDILVLDVAARRIVQKFGATKDIEYLRFSNDGRQLKTDQGVLALPPNLDASGGVSLKPLPTPSILYSENGEWITRCGQKFLWLPPDYRGTCWERRGRTLALGRKSGVVDFIEFPNQR